MTKKRIFLWHHIGWKNTLWKIKISPQISEMHLWMHHASMLWCINIMVNQMSVTLGEILKIIPEKHLRVFSTNILIVDQPNGIPEDASS